MKSSQSLKTLIQKKVKLSNIAPNIILRYVIFDFFLEKLSLSKYTSNFIIKGGFLISTITKINFRTTMDLDVTLKSLTLSKEILRNIINDIISIPTHELVTMKLVEV